jgi:hypothetical protein
MVQKSDRDARRMTGRTLVVALGATVAEIALKLQDGIGLVEKKRSKGSEDLQFSDDGAARDFATLDLIVRAKVGSSNDDLVRTTCYVVPPRSVPFPGKTGACTATGSTAQSDSARQGSALTKDSSPAQCGPASG